MGGDMFELSFLRSLFKFYLTGKKLGTPIGAPSFFVAIWFCHDDISIKLK